MNKNDYINSVISNIKSNSARQDIKSEISAHIDDRIEYYTDCGMDKVSALQKALERMGEPDTIAEKFENLYSNPQYKILSYILTALYTVGLIAGVILSICCLSYTVDISDTMSACGLCFGSVMVFICSVLSLIFALKSKEPLPLRILGTVSIVGAVASPVTLVPCGYTILSLLFDYIPDLFTGDEFKYFYYPFNNIYGFEVLVHFLWIFMFLFGVFAITTGLLSLKFSKDYIDSVSLSKRNRKTAKTYIIILIVLASVAVFNFSFETLVAVNQNISNQAIVENDTNEGLNIFDNIALPFNEEKFLSDFPECYAKTAVYDEEVFELYSNFACVIYVRNNKLTKEFDNTELMWEKKCYSENEIINLNSTIKIGITLDEFFAVFDKNKVAVYSVSLKDGNEIINIEYAGKKLPFAAYYTFENGVLTDRYLS